MKKIILSLIFTIAFAIALQAQTVYITDGGKKFHKKNCSVVKEGKKGVELTEAKKQGYTACAVCKPDEATEPKKKK